MAQITHRTDPETGALRQVVTPAELRAILDADGDSYERPAEFGDADEWDVGEGDDDEHDEACHGHTFTSWLRAAGRVDSTSEYDLRAAWRAGEDPEEYR